MITYVSQSDCADVRPDRFMTVAAELNPADEDAEGKEVAAQ